MTMVFISILFVKTKDAFIQHKKPIAPMEDLIKKHSNEEGTILDCFAGSGTTGVAALKTGRHFIGCEINKEYYEKSLKRMEDLG